MAERCRCRAQSTSSAVPGGHGERYREDETRPRSYLQSIDLAPMMVIVILLVVYVLLGLFMDPLTTLFITVPVIAALVVSLGFDPVWWGVVTIVVVEIGLIHPPFGLNAFIIKGIAGTKYLSERSCPF